jgi:hypothetical protein
MTPPFWLGGQMPMSSSSTNPPGSPTLWLTASKQLTLDAPTNSYVYSWYDQISGYEFTQEGRTDMNVGTINGLPALTFGTSSFTGVVQNTAATLLSLITASSWAICAIWSYSGDITESGHRDGAPSIIGDADNATLGIFCAKDTSTGNLLTNGYMYNLVQGNVYSPTGGYVDSSGGLGVPHYSILTLSGGTLYYFLDGVELGSTACDSLSGSSWQYSSFSAAEAGGGIGSDFVGAIRTIVVYGASIPNVGELNSWLAGYGNF